MSTVKAGICTFLLFIVVIMLLFATIFVKGAYEITLFRFLTSWMAGMYIGDKLGDFYKWLLKKTHKKNQVFEQCWRTDK